ncbi:sugar transferase [Symbiobacterium thermophilum]|uniref:Bacterial sugar transferase domain-containing protein n=1 Tax=Symbiobacterium thermophilum TaxID=2734 RepID=A0A953IBD2_SYMTR|nr:sugar transferase [Symbiobacterium thermophilum]MBY6277953.1 hypothetical protein [Symbiobacterium thermophilum]
MRRGLRIWLLPIGDVVLTLGAYLLAFLIRLRGFPEYNWSGFLQVAPLIVVTTLLLLVVYNQYRELHRPFLEVAAGSVLTAIGTTLIAGVGAYLDVEARSFPRSILLLGGIMQAVFLPTWRVWFVRQTKREYFRRPAVIVTMSPERWAPFPKYIRVQQRVTPELFWAQEAHFRGYLVVMDSDLPGSERERLMEWAATTQNDLYLIPTLHDLMVHGSRFSKLGDRPVIAVRPLVVPIEYRWLKRLFDLVVAGCLVVLFSPAFVLVPLAIMLESGRPVLYRQTRVGEGGRLFELYKFRSMVVDAERETGPVVAVPGDARVTRVGRVLRLTRLDELPQLFNVLKGDMSLVGPRPERPELVEQIAEEQPNFRLRELVRPGLTGLAQVMGRYLTSPDDKLRYDLAYIASYSPWMDVRILLWTVQVMLFPQEWVDSPPEWVQQLDWQATIR